MTARQADPARPTPASSLQRLPTEAGETHKQEVVVSLPPVRKVGLE